MQVLHHYCDRCGKQISSGTGSELVVNGVQLEGAVSARIKTAKGAVEHTHSKTLSGTEFCGSTCFSEAVGVWMKEIKQVMPA